MEPIGWPSRVQLIELLSHGCRAPLRPSAAISIDRPSSMVLRASICRRPDLLYTLVGSFGIPVPVKTEFCVQRHIGILRPSGEIGTSFLASFMASGFVFEQANRCATGIAQRTIPLAGLRAFKVPLPPLGEQSRIVAKVDALMALCERLKESLTSTGRTRSLLLDALLDNALAAAEEREMEAAE